MIFITRDASSKSEIAMQKVTLTRLSLGRSNSIDSLSCVNSTRCRRKCRYTSRRASRYSTYHHLRFRIVVESEDKGYQDRSYPPRPRTWLGSSRQRPNWIRGSRETAWFAYRALTPRFGYGSAAAKRRQHHRLEPPIGQTQPERASYRPCVLVSFCVASLQPVPLPPKIAHALALIGQSFYGSIRPKVRENPRAKTRPDPGTRDEYGFLKRRSASRLFERGTCKTFDLILRKIISSLRRLL